MHLHIFNIQQVEYKPTSDIKVYDGENLFNAGLGLVSFGIGMGVAALGFGLGYLFTPRAEPLPSYTSPAGNVYESDNSYVDARNQTLDNYGTIAYVFGALGIIGTITGIPMLIVGDYRKKNLLSNVAEEYKFLLDYKNMTGDVFLGEINFNSYLRYDLSTQNFTLILNDTNNERTFYTLSIYSILEIKKAFNKYRKWRKIAIQSNDTIEKNITSIKPKSIIVSKYDFTYHTENKNMNIVFDSEFPYDDNPILRLQFGKLYKSDNKYITHIPKDLIFYSYDDDSSSNDINTFFRVISPKNMKKTITEFIAKQDKKEKYQ